jgi:hypothetical protein
VYCIFPRVAQHRFRLGPLLRLSSLCSERPQKTQTKREQFGASQSPTPATAAARSKQIGELKTTVTIQDGTISKLRAQLSSLQASHESHAAIVADTHAAEVASLKNRASLLEQQLAERPTLRHGKCPSSCNRSPLSTRSHRTSLPGQSRTCLFHACWSLVPHPPPTSNKWPADTPQPPAITFYFFSILRSCRKLQTARAHRRLPAPLSPPRGPPNRY